MGEPVPWPRDKELTEKRLRKAFKRVLQMYKHRKFGVSRVRLARKAKQHCQKSSVGSGAAESGKRLRDQGEEPHTKAARREHDATPMEPPEDAASRRNLKAQDRNHQDPRPEPAASSRASPMCSYSYRTEGPNTVDGRARSTTSWRLGLHSRTTFKAALTSPTGSLARF